MSPAGFTWADAAAFSSLSESTLRRWVRRGVLQVSRVGGRVVVLRSSLEALMRGEGTAPVSPVPARPSRGLVEVTAGAPSREPNHSVLVRRRGQK